MNLLLENVYFRKRDLLLKFTIMCLILLSLLEAQPKNQLQEKLLVIDSLIYKNNDYQTALLVCQEVMAMKNIGKYYKEKVTSIINLIENYSDCDQKPLALYFKARNIIEMWCKGKRHTKESEAEQGSLYQELLNKYSECKLAGFVQYLLANHYEKQIGNTNRYLDNETARQKAIEEYNKVINQYPLAIFPICGYPQYFKLGLKIAPLAQINIAWLYKSSYYVKPDIGKALATYQIIINQYLDAVDKKGYRLILSAYVSMLNIYCDDEGFVDTTKAKEICHLLINHFPNQKYEIEGWHFGEIHPEAYWRLAKLEPFKEKAIKLYKKIMTDFPRSWTGQSGSGAISLYSVNSLSEIIKLLGNPQLVITECRNIINSRLDKSIQGYAQFMIAKTYEQDLRNYERALIEYQIILDNYNDVCLDGEPWTLGDGAKDAMKAIQEKLNK